MGFLDKHIPRATRRSAIAWAVGGGIVGGVVGFVGWLRTDLPFKFVFFIVLWMIAAGALGGWAIEWQMPWEPDEDE